MGTQSRADERAPTTPRPDTLPEEESAGPSSKIASPVGRGWQPSTDAAATPWARPRAATSPDVPPLPEAGMPRAHVAARTRGWTVLWGVVVVVLLLIAAAVSPPLAILLATATLVAALVVRLRRRRGVIEGEARDGGWRHVIEGEARNVQQRPDQGFTITSFRVDRYDAAGNRLSPVPVELRGLRFRGTIAEGDRVRIKASWERGRILRPRGVRNLSTGEMVRAKTGAGYRIGLAIGWLFLLLFLTGIVALVVGIVRH